MYKIVKSTDNGLDEMELERLEKGYWLDTVSYTHLRAHET